MQISEQSQKKYFIGVVLGICIVVGSISMQFGGSVQTAKNQDGSKAKYTIVLDSGHGGIDPGKVGVNQAYEKDINLSIAKLLKEHLEQNDCRVVMTRDSDEGLYEESDSNKKMADMRRRVEIIEESEADLIISIHQNSFSQASSKGAQVFYQVSSEQGKLLAEQIQKSLIQEVDPENHRQAKSNADYYLLQKTKGTMVIVECGFLSNPEEAELLCDSEHQRKIARAITLGILEYLGKSGQETESPSPSA